MAGRFETVEVDGSVMPVYLAGGDGGAGVLVCMHAPGVDEFIQDICHRLADSGFVAAAPDLYHRQEEGDLNPLERMGLLRDEEILRDYAVAADWLAGRSDRGRQCVIGFCMGGRLSYLWAAHRDRLQAAAVFYGGNILVPWGEGPTPLGPHGGDRLSAPRALRQRRREPEPRGRRPDRGGTRPDRQGLRVPPLRRGGPRVPELHAAVAARGSRRRRLEEVRGVPAGAHLKAGRTVELGGAGRATAWTLSGSGGGRHC